MQLSTKSKILGASILALGLVAGSAATIHAQTTTTGNNPFSNLVTAISSKFNLNQSDVQNVVDQVMADSRAKMEANKQQEFADRLAQAVKDAKLTQAQADLIAAKAKEVHTFMDSLKDKTVAERQTAMKTEMDSLKQWATENNIPQQFLMFAGPYRFEGHGHGRFGFGMMHSSANSN